MRAILTIALGALFVFAQDRTVDLAMAAKKRDIAKKTPLVKAGANVNASGKDKKTALMWASAYGHPQDGSSARRRMPSFRSRTARCQ